MYLLPRDLEIGKKVHNEKNCTFLTHIREDPCSPHNNAMKSYKDLQQQSRHIDKLLNAQSTKQIQNNQIRVKTSIDVVRWLAFQGCAFRGHDETSDSMNQGNFLEMIKILALYNDKVAKVVFQNAPKYAKYTSHTIQKEILQVMESKVRDKIREDIRDSKFCIIADEARDKSKRKQMAIVLRFVDKDGFIDLLISSPLERGILKSYHIISQGKATGSIVAKTCKHF
jgi:hypothetical protein